jgi:ankyrin repeat protein
MSPPLFARLLHVQTHISPRRNRITSGISDAIEWMNQNMRQTEEQRKKNSLAVCEAAGRHLRSRSLECLVTEEYTISVTEKAQHWLAAAIVVGHVRSVKGLLMGGIYPDEENLCFGQPLPLAAAFGHLEIVQHLLCLGADVRGMGQYYTFIHDGLPGRADASNQIRPSSLGRSPLEEAALIGNYGIIGALLESRGAHSISQSEYKRAALAAASTGHIHLISLLIEYAGFGFDSAFGNQLFGKACENGQLDVVRMLVEKGVHVNAECEWRSMHTSGLQLASFHGHVDVLEFLLHNEADRDCEKGYYGNAINIAVMNGHEEAVQLFLEFGSDINQISKSKHLIQIAADHGQVHMLRFLLSKGADINTRVLNGYTAGQLALEQAVMTGLSPVIRGLVETGIPLDGQHFHPVLDAMLCRTDHSLSTLMELGAQNLQTLGGFYPTQFENCSYPMGMALNVNGFPITTESCHWVGKY